MTARTRGGALVLSTVLLVSLLAAATPVAAFAAPFQATVLPQPATTAKSADVSEIALDAARKHLWVASYNKGTGSTLQALSVASETYSTAPIAISPASSVGSGAAPLGVGVDENAGLVFALTSDRVVTTVDASTGKVVRSTPLSVQASAYTVDHLTVDPGNHRAFALERDDDLSGPALKVSYRIWTVDGTTGASQSRAYGPPAVSNGRTNSDLFGLAYNSASQSLIGIAGSGLVVIDPATGSATKTIEAGVVFGGLAIDTVSGTIFALSSPDSPEQKFVAIDSTSLTVTTLAAPSVGGSTLLGVDAASGPVYYVTRSATATGSPGSGTSVLSGGRLTDVADFESRSVAVDITTHVAYAAGAANGQLVKITSPAAPTPQLTVGTPTVEGKWKVGKTLTVSPGIWGPSPVALSFQWRRDGKPIAGAVKPAYKLKTADARRTVSVTVTGTKSGFAVGSATATGRIVAGIAGPTPKIKGKLRVGHVVTAVVGTWKPKGVKQSYKWYRSGKAIAGATSKTYRLKAADVGKRISVHVIGKKKGYVTTTKSSKRTAKVRR